jgi:hypothetical protein
MRWVGHVVVHMGEINEFKTLDIIPQGERSHRRSSCRWEVNIRMNLGEMEWEGVNWIHVAQNRDQWQALMYMVMKLSIEL